MMDPPKITNDMTFEFFVRNEMKIPTKIPAVQRQTPKMNKIHNVLSATMSKTIIVSKRAFMNDMVMNIKQNENCARRISMG